MWSTDKQRFNKLMGTLHSPQDNERVGASLRYLSGCLLSAVKHTQVVVTQRLSRGQWGRSQIIQIRTLQRAGGSGGWETTEPSAEDYICAQLSKMSFPFPLVCPPIPCPTQGEPKTRRGKNKSASTDQSSLILFSLEGPTSLGQASTFGGKEWRMEL